MADEEESKDIAKKGIERKNVINGIPRSRIYCMRLKNERRSQIVLPAAPTGSGECSDKKRVRFNPTVFVRYIPARRN